MSSAIEIAREFFPGASPGELDYVIWNETGFPCFWPERALTVEQNFRLQLAEAAGIRVADIVDI